ncbi:hypothetical protein BDY21DRAFT_283074, partial [Lineolata rhizophorae]
ETLPDHVATISLASLSRLFPDAVSIYRFLGVQYLSIDSPYSLQGDPVDWENQSVLMGSVYENTSYMIVVHDDSA